MELSDSKRKLSKNVERGSRDEQVGTKRDRQLPAVTVQACRENDLEYTFAQIERRRKRVRRSPVDLKALIEEGRV